MIPLFVVQECFHVAGQETGVDNRMRWMEDKVKDLCASRNVVPRHWDSKLRRMEESPRKMPTFDFEDTNPMNDQARRVSRRVALGLTELGLGPDFRTRHGRAAQTPQKPQDEWYLDLSTPQGTYFGVGDDTSDRALVPVIPTQDYSTHL